MITTRFPNRAPNTVWGNLTMRQMWILGCAVSCVLLISLAPNTVIAAVFLTSGAVLAGFAFARFEGRLLVDRLPVLVGWWTKRRTGQQGWRRTVTDRPRPGLLNLPGDAARLQWVELASGAVAVHDPYTMSVSASVSCRQPAFRLLAGHDQEARVKSWSTLLASLAQRAHGARVQVSETSVPDPGQSVVEYAKTHTVKKDGFAATEYQELLASHATTGVRHDTTVTISIDVRRRSGLSIERRSEGSALEISLERLDALLSVLMSTLADSGLLDVAPLTSQHLAARIVQAYRPTAVQPTAATLGEAGPMSVEEHPTHIELDAGFAAVLWVAAWPRTEVPVDFLHHVMFTNVQKTISLFISPLTTGEALRGISKEATRADAKARDAEKHGKRLNIFDRRAEKELAEREDALADGAADARFTGFITLTAATLPELSDALDQVEASAAASGIHTEPMIRQHAQAFTTTRLPLGRKVHS